MPRALYSRRKCPPPHTAARSLSPLPFSQETSSPSLVCSQGWGQKNFLEDLSEKSKRASSRDWNLWEGSAEETRVCALPGTFIPGQPLLLFQTSEPRRVLSLPHEGKHLGKFGERQNSELSTFLFLFFFLRNFFLSLFIHFSSRSLPLPSRSPSLLFCSLEPFDSSNQLLYLAPVPAPSPCTPVCVTGVGSHRGQAAFHTLPLSTARATQR